MTLPMKAGLLVLLAILLAIGWQARSSTPDLALSDRDTWGYLSPALSAMSDRGFHQEGGRGWFYPALVKVALGASGSIAKIAVGQKFLGWATGLLIALTWAGWVAFLPLGRVGRFVALLVGAVPLLAQMINPQTLYFELQIRPEAVMPFFVFAQLCCLMGYIRNRWQYPRPIASLLFGLWALLLAYLCILLKPSWLLAGGATCLPVFAGVLIGREVTLAVRLATPVVGLLAILFTTSIPGRLSFIKDSESVTVLPQTMFCLHARWIKDSLQHRLDKIPDTDPDKPRLAKVVAVLKEEFAVAEKGAHNYEFLGYDPDYLRYRSRLIGTIAEYTHGSDKEFSAFCMKAYQQALLDQPFGMAGKVFTQYLHFLFPKPSTFLKTDMDMRRGCQYSLESLPATVTPDYSPEAVRLLQEYREELQRQEPTAPTLKAWNWLEPRSKNIAGAALPLEIGFLAALALAHVFGYLHRLRLAGWAAFFLFAAPAGNALTVAIVHALDIGRYRAGYGEFHLFALMAMAVFLAVMLERISLHTFPNFADRLHGRRKT